MKTQSRVGGRYRLLASSRFAMPPGAARRSSRSSSRSSVRPACLPRMPHGSHHLIRSPRVSLLASSARLSSSAHRLAPVSYRPAPRPIRQAGRGETTIDGGRLGHLFSPSHRLIKSATAPPGRPIGLAPGSSHRRGGGFLFLFARPPPACSSRSACLGLFPRPRPGDVLAAVWLAAAGVRAACVRSHLPFRSLAAARSLVAIRLVSLVPLCLPGALWGILWVISAAYLSALAFLNICP